jgi:hypothetical protein
VRGRTGKAGLRGKRGTQGGLSFFFIFLFIYILNLVVAFEIQFKHASWV